MTVINWPKNVNTEFHLEGDHGYAGDYIKTLQFASGKKRMWLSNSHVPGVYPALSLLLGNVKINDNGLTEFEEFKKWFEVNLRYGTLPFYAPRIGFKPGPTTKTGEIGIYEFTPGSLNYEDTDGIVPVTFGMEEISFLSETRYAFLMTDDGKILLTDRGQYILV
jgi:hypothetical protein